MTTLSLPAAAIDEAAIRAFKATLCNSDGVYLTPARMREEIADTFAKLRAAAVEQPALGQQEIPSKPTDCSVPSAPDEQGVSTIGVRESGHSGSTVGTVAPSAQQGPEQPVAAVPVPGAWTPEAMTNEQLQECMGRLLRAALKLNSPDAAIDAATRPTPSTKP